MKTSLSRDSDNTYESKRFNQIQTILTQKKFLELYAEELNLPINHVETAPGKWVSVMKCAGSDENLKSIILNSHIDVVPVYPDHWKHPPFSAHKDQNGDIWARGSQDMKLVGIQYMEAIRRLRAKNSEWKPKRTFYVMWVPDEEIGGHDGMEKLILNHRDYFDSLNIGYELDEGLANPENVYRVFYGERSPWWIKVIATGQPGHGSAFIKNSAGERLHKYLAKVMEFRNFEENRLNSNDDEDIQALGDVTTVNWTIASGGVQPNVVPAELSAVLDFRVTPKFPIAKFQEMVENWAKEIGGIKIEYIQKCLFQGCSDLNSDFVKNLEKSFSELKIDYKYEIFPAATDARYLRELDIPSIGFSAMIGEEILLHDHNERLNEKTFLRGVEIYETILGNFGEF